MSEQSDVSQGGPNPVMDNFNRMPASDTAPTSEYAPRNRFLTKDKSVHQLLGGGRGMFNIYSKDSLYIFTWSFRVAVLGEIWACLEFLFGLVYVEILA